jgi:ribonuclease HI
MGKTYSKVLRRFRLTTNNRMELLAVIVGLEKLKNQNTKYLLFLIPSMVDSILKKWVLVGRKRF